MKKRRQAHNHPEMTPQELARCRPASEVDPFGLPIPTHLVSNDEYFPPFLQTASRSRSRPGCSMAWSPCPIGSTSAAATSCRRRPVSPCRSLPSTRCSRNTLTARRCSGWPTIPRSIMTPSSPTALRPTSSCSTISAISSAGARAGSVYAPERSSDDRPGRVRPLPELAVRVQPLEPRESPRRARSAVGQLDPKLLVDTHIYDTLILAAELHRALLPPEPDHRRAHQQRPRPDPLLAHPCVRRRRALRRTQRLRSTSARDPHRRPDLRLPGEFINAVSGSTRALSHGIMYMGPGNLWYLQEQIDQFGVDSWKGYQNPQRQAQRRPRYDVRVLDVRRRGTRFSHLRVHPPRLPEARTHQARAQLRLRPQGPRRISVRERHPARRRGVPRPQLRDLPLLHPPRPLRLRGLAGRAVGPVAATASPTSRTPPSSPSSSAPYPNVYAETRHDLRLLAS